MDPKKRFIDNIRLKKFGIGSGELNPLALDVHEAVKQLSAELYQKDLHFVMELLQNAEDNKYADGIMPTIEFLLTDKDVAGVGAVGTLLVLNNEVGFEEPNILSLCSIGQSTKKGKRQSGGYVGEKGIGFKSVFLVSKKPHIISNGFQICFNQAADEEAKVGYIVPTWVDNPCIVNDLNAIYAHKELPKTTIMLPICDEKIVRSVKDQLKELSPELVLFLSKIRKICFDYEGTRYSVIRQAKEEESSRMLRKVELSQLEESASRTVKNVPYYLWTDRLSVKEESRIEQRKDVKEWVISIAFPMGRRITGSLGVGDVFAFLPTQVKSGFRFLLNSDFLLISSRESIHYDSPWNQGILECIPQTFQNAFECLLRTLPPSQTVSVYDFVPYDASPCFEHVCRKILSGLQSATVILCARNVGLQYGDAGSKFCKPEMARMVSSSLREILEEAAEMGIPPDLIRCGGIHIVDKQLQEKQSNALSRLNVRYLTAAEFSQLLSEQWLLALPEECYLKVLCYISSSVGSWDMRYFRYTPLIKYMNEETDKLEMASIANASSSSEWRIYRPHNDQAWIGNWAKEFTPQVGIAFMSQDTVECMLKVSKRSENSHAQITRLENWLENNANVTALNTAQFTEQLVGKFEGSTDSITLIKIMHFLYNAQKDNHMTKEAAKEFAVRIKYLDSSGIVKKSSGLTVLLPPSVSRWPTLITDNSWDEQLLKLSDAYLRDPFTRAGRDVRHLDYEGLIRFLKDVCAGKDIPNIEPQNFPLPILKNADPGKLPREAITLLFKWMKATCCHNHQYLVRFRDSIKESNWLKTINHGWKCPTEAFLYQKGSKWRGALQSDDLPFIDESFYGVDLSDYKLFLEWIGVSSDESYTPYSCSRIAKFMESESSSGRMTHETAVRLYSYMRTVSWSPETSLSIPISVPDCRKMAIWKHKDQCVIEDETGLFAKRLSVLAMHYNSELLEYFRTYLHVPAMPKAEEYTQLWLDWMSKPTLVRLEDCKKVWHVIATNWAASYSDYVKIMFISGCKQVLSCNYTGGGKDRQVQLAGVGEVLVVDDMCTVQVFEEANMCPRLAWFPTDSESAQWLPKLNSVYKSLGLKLLSQCITKNSNFAGIAIRQFIHREDGYLWKKGMWRLVLGYLANPSFGLTFHQRKSLVSAVTGTTEYEVFNGLTQTFTLSGGFSANRTSLVAWIKRDKQMFYSERPENIAETRKKMELMWEFAECISMGLLSEQYPSLIGGLQELLLTAGGYIFDDSATSALLRIKNLRLFDEDEAFLDGLNCVL